MEDLTMCAGCGQRLVPDYGQDGPYCSTCWPDDIERIEMYRELDAELDRLAKRDEAVADRYFRRYCNSTKGGVA